jgi:hypothetical protein
MQTNISSVGNSTSTSVIKEIESNSSISEDTSSHSGAPHSAVPANSADAFTTPRKRTRTPRAEELDALCAELEQTLRQKTEERDQHKRDKDAVKTRETTLEIRKIKAQLKYRQNK